LYRALRAAKPKRKRKYVAKESGSLSPPLLSQWGAASLFLRILTVIVGITKACFTTSQFLRSSHTVCPTGKTYQAQNNFSSHLSVRLDDFLLRRSSRPPNSSLAQQETLHGMMEVGDLCHRSHHPRLSRALRTGPNPRSPH